MTASAIASERTTVNVFFRMTGVAAGRQARVSDILLTMTAVASGLGMSTGQGKFCLLAVVEVHPTPAIGRMATLAARGEAAIMHIVISMTVAATHIRILVGGGCVAGFTGHHRVQAGQRVVCQAMIESDILVPRQRIVTVLADIAQLTAMDVLFAMAGRAGH